MLFMGGLWEITYAGHKYFLLRTDWLVFLSVALDFFARKNLKPLFHLFSAICSFLFILFVFYKSEKNSLVNIMAYSIFLNMCSSIFFYAKGRR